MEVLGFDYYNPKTGNVESGSKKNIAMWQLDTDYDERSLFPSQVFFPMAGNKEGWAKLAKNLKAEIDPEKIEAFRGTVSLTDNGSMRMEPCFNISIAPRLELSTDFLVYPFHERTIHRSVRSVSSK